MSVKIRSSYQASLMAMSSTYSIKYFGMGSAVNLFLAILCPVLMLMNLHLPWIFLVESSYMDPCNLWTMILMGNASSYVSAYVPKYAIQCLK